MNQPLTFNQIYSMTSSHKIRRVLCESITGETEWGVDGEGGRERKRAADKWSE